MTAAQLVQTLGLEKSSVSRMLSRLMTAGEICEVPSADDARYKQLKLTPKGAETVNKINEYGAMRVAEALRHLNPAQQQQVVRGLGAYVDALKECRSGEASGTACRQTSL